MRHKDLIIPPPPENPFLNCKLGREKYADVLTSIVSSYADGFVLAINNEWGTGKTTFVKMWQQSLENQEFKTCYFNAWENDFESEPLVAIMAELKTLTKPGKEIHFKLLAKKSAIVAKSVLPTILKAVADKYIDIKSIAEAIQKTTEAATEILKDEIDEYEKKKDGLLDFREKLKEFIEESNDGKPLIFLIDELDRCRPDYAVEVLENVKHFFSVPGIVFVLSIDKEQLGNAIRGYYGSEMIAADEYLKRFIDIEYKLPDPNVKEVCQYFYEYFGLGLFFNSSKRINIQIFGDEPWSFQKIVSILGEYRGVTLRQQEKLYAHSKVVLGLLKYNEYALPALLYWLIFIREFHFELFNGIKSRKLTPQNLLEKYESLVPSNLLEENQNLFLQTETELLVLYSNYYKERHKTFNIIHENKSGRVLNVVFKLRGISVNDIVMGVYDGLSRTIKEMSLNHLLSKIELLENITA